MNIILLEPDDLIGENRARLTGRRLDHIRACLKAGPGDELAVGQLNGNLGRGTILTMEAEEMEITFELNKPPPLPLPVTLIIALPRPKMFNRVLQSATSMGVKQIYLINAWRVEKSYWKSPKLEEASLREQLILGLEQAKDTLIPEVHLKRLFSPFVRKELPELMEGVLPLLAHPGGSTLPPNPHGKPVILVVGPEGGFIEREVETFREIGFQPFSLGERILRVETAVPTLISRFMSF